MEIIGRPFSLFVSLSFLFFGLLFKLERPLSHVAGFYSSPRVFEEFFFHDITTGMSDRAVREGRDSFLCFSFSS